MVGRIPQIATLNYLLTSEKSEFLAVTGRRRVGKTFLIDTVYKNKICLRISGIQNGDLETQLNNFMEKLAEQSKQNYKKTKSWQEAFSHTKQYCKTLSKRKKHVIFLDELPWMNSPKSGFVQLLAHFWNDYMSKETNFILVICGSASSWITKKIINDKGGLHNRLTEIIQLKPFTLAETKAFFENNKIRLSDQNIVLLYMAFGGIPFYLNLIKKGDSAITAIERLCFENGSILQNEYQNLYKALFYNSTDHEAIVGALSNTKNGITRETLLAMSKVKAGGPYNRAMDDLILSGFISEDTPFGRKKRGSIYRLNDEYSVFYHKFIKTAKRNTPDIWKQIAASQSYKIWTGHAFESLCFKHIDKIKAALGISGVYTEFYAFLKASTADTEGFQIDLVLDRKDDVINLCEIKFYGGSFTIDKNYANKLTNRRQQFIEETHTKKQVHIAFITNYELVNNEYSREIVDSSLTIDSFF